MFTSKEHEMKMMWQFPDCSGAMGNKRIRMRWPAQVFVA